MERYQRILVCLEEPERDAHMLAYVRAIARLAESKDIHILHVRDDQAPGLDDESVDTSAATEVTGETLRALAAEHLERRGFQGCHCAVLHGAPLLEVLRFAHDQEVDLIVVGRRYGPVHEPGDEALLARRITRKATCSVLVLTEDFQVKSDAILVPVRDSECSANALDVACGIAVATKAAVIAFNVCRVHTGYARVGTTLEEHEALLEAAARRECERLLKRVDTSGVAVRCKCAPDLEGNPVPIILEAVARDGADLVVIGARGRTGAAGVLLGTVTEQLIRQCPVPVLAVKKKGECLGILRALLTLAGEG